MQYSFHDSGTPSKLVLIEYWRTEVVGYQSSVILSKHLGKNLHAETGYIWIS